MQAPSERAIPECGFARSFPMWVKPEVCLVQACLAAPSHPYLVIYSNDLDVRGLSIIPDSSGSTVSYMHSTSSPHYVCVFDV